MIKERPPQTMNKVDRWRLGHGLSLSAACVSCNDRPVVDTHCPGYHPITNNDRNHTLLFSPSYFCEIHAAKREFDALNSLARHFQSN